MTPAGHSAQRRRPVEARSFRLLFAALALLNLLAAAWVVWDEAVTRRPWKRYQQQFNGLQARRGKSPAPVRIRQTTNPALGVVDRCQTCHLGVDRRDLGGRDVPPVFRAHPRRRALLGKNHPPGVVGCTACHHGQGPQTKGVGHAAFDHGRNDPYWERPMLRGAFTESTCARCHTAELQIPGAPTYNLGRRLFQQRRCFGCHAGTRGDPGYPAGPSLAHLRHKTSAALVRAWLLDPPGLRPGTRMPRFWSKPRGPGSVARQEVIAITAYLGSLQPPRPLTAAPAAAAPGLARQGQQLFGQLGCRGCHVLDPVKERDAPAEERHGPALARIGDKASPRWLAAWLADPRKVWSRARMPDLRLKAAERAALVAFLSTQDRRLPAAQRGWPAASPALIEQGRAAVSRHGCAGCHELPGMPKGAQLTAGPELSTFGDRTADRLEWGDARGVVRCDELSALECWTVTKIRQPRRTSSARVKLAMPDHKLTRREARALAVFVLSHRSDTAPQAARRVPPPAEQVLQAGEALLDRFNCRGCHEVGRLAMPDLDQDGDLVGTRYLPFGGQLRRHLAQRALAPPSLTFAGEKFQYPWLHDYLGQPTRLRPWLKARMPSFAFTADQRRQLVRYLARRSQRGYPFQQIDRAPVAPADRPDARWLFAKMQCYKCHQVSSVKGLKLADLAPDLALSHRRLQPGWIRRWIKDPQQLQPGTKMPSYFPLADDDDPTSHTTPFAHRLGGSVERQVGALVRMNMRFGVDPELVDLAVVPSDSGAKGRNP